MSWRVVAAVMIAIFSILAVATLTAEPIRQVGDTIQDVADNNPDVDSQDVSEQRTSGIRAYDNLMLILIGGLLAWAAWRLLRRELTEGRL